MSTREESSAASDVYKSKYQGTGNDFVMIDDRAQKFDDSDLKLVSMLCDRKFGVGADGLILIRNHADYDFEMIYFNADGSQSMCGNGARCAVAFSAFLGILDSKTSFLAIYGPHEATLKDGLVPVSYIHLTLPTTPYVSTLVRVQST